MWHFNVRNTLLRYLQNIGGQGEVRRRRGPIQSQARAVDDAGRRLLGPRQGAAAVERTGAAAGAAAADVVPARPGAPGLQAAQRHEQAGEDAEARRTDAMFSLV